MISLLPMVFGLLWIKSSYVDCYDAYYTCSKPLRSAKSKALYPCDLTSQTWCTMPGSYYPWRAVRRFVYENHGLMRRMYGDERHISVLRSNLDIDSNDIDYLESVWSHDVNKYKLTKEEIRNREKHASTTTRKSTTKTTTTTSPATTTTSPTTITLINETTPTANLETTTLEEEITTQDDYTTTDSTTTTEDVTMPTTTENFVEDKTKPIIYQDTVERPTPTTTEQSQILFKSKGVNACPVKEEVVAPFWANNTRGEVLALLNLYPFEQYVHWERCTFENKQMFCRAGCRCEQQYRLHRLLAYDPTNDCRGIFSDWFRFPSCCVCRCYDLPGDIRLTSRSPRNANNSTNN